jgi:hypothetical protein
VRDNSIGMPELLAAYERNGERFGAMRLLLEAGPAAVEFWVDEAGYGAMRRVLQTKPFAVTPGVPHRYFFTGQTGSMRVDGAPVEFDIRIESQRDARTFKFSGPKSLVSNLVWFQGLKEHADLAHLQPFSPT